MRIPPAIRYSAIIMSVIFLLLTIGFYFQMSWATSIWPWPDSRLSYIFIASITAAIGVNILWIGLVGDVGAAFSGSINLSVVNGGVAIYMFQLYSTRGDQKLL